jgi:beta-glucosidase
MAPSGTPAPARAGAPFANDGNVTPTGGALTQAKLLIDPRGLVEVLAELRDRYNNPPVVITENGAPFPDRPETDGRVRDLPRIDYLHRHIVAAHEGLGAGCDVRGYFAWSLLDNWEWTAGYDQRFGLVYVDFDTGARTPKASYQWFASVVRRNGVMVAAAPDTGLRP